MIVLSMRDHPSSASQAHPRINVTTQRRLGALVARSCGSLFVLCILALAMTTADAADPSIVTADAVQLGPAMTHGQLGANLLALFQESGDPTYIPLLSGAGIGLIRWPGGGTADAYHWQTNSYGPCVGYLSWPGTGFDNWMQNFARPLGADVAITVNYGSNATCTGPGDPAEAAAWVNYANNVRHYGIKYWTVGNEQYFHEIDVDTPQFDPSVYASRVANQFYPLMKAQDPTIKVGIDLAFGNATHDARFDPWDSIVLAQAQYDFVEMHYYPEYNNQDDDTSLLTTSVDQLAADFASVRTLLAQHGHADATIFLGEFDRDSGVPAGYGGPGHESVSIVNALFNAMVVGEVVKAGVTMSAAWLGIDTCEFEATSPPASTAYGWQAFGSFGMFANSGANSPYSCQDKGVTPRTPFPKARAFQILKNYVIAGEHPIVATSSNPAVRAYAATNNGGYAFLLINTDSANNQTVSLQVNSASATLFDATALTYGKQQYDESKNGAWLGPVTTSLGISGSSLDVMLSPWSINLVRLAPRVNYQGLWFKPDESGWGINLAHQGDLIFASWFTYDLAGKGTWLVMSAAKTAPGTYTGTLIQGTGPAFDAVPFPPLGTPGGATVSGLTGPATLAFSDANNGTFTYTVNGIMQTKAITRQLFGPQPVCTFGAQANLALATNYTDLWWAVPAGFESGWGINLTHQGDLIFATWFTFARDHTPMWLVGTASKTAPGVYTITQLGRLTGPPFNTVPFPPLGSPGGPVISVVGDAKFTFTDGNTATFNYTVDGVMQTKTITRQVFAGQGTTCQ